MGSGFQREDLNWVIRQQAEQLAAQLHAQRESLFPPDAHKAMRKFTSGEAAALLGVNDSYLRKLNLDGKGPSPELTGGNRRLYSAQDIQDLRQLLEKTARKPGDYLPGRRQGDHLQIIGVMNFKGGSGKTTTAAHLAQRLALLGYRVLAIDLDPQASLTALHGVQPEIDIPEGGTLYDAIRYDDPCPIRDVIRVDPAGADEDPVVGHQRADALVGEPQQRLPIDDLQQLLRPPLTRQRPQAGAGSAGHDHDKSHGGTVPER